jgi:hypothetical protein
VVSMMGNAASRKPREVAQPRQVRDPLPSPYVPQLARCSRHADIRTTMNVYGDVVTNEIAQAKGTGLALNGLQSGLHAR